MFGLWSDNYNVTILNVGILLLFSGGWSGSGVIFMMLQ